MMEAFFLHAYDSVAARLRMALRDNEEITIRHAVAVRKKTDLATTLCIDVPEFDLKANSGTVIETFGQKRFDMDNFKRHLNPNC